MTSSLGRYLAAQGLQVDDNGAPSRPGTFRHPVQGVMWHHTVGTCNTSSTAGEIRNARAGGLYNLLVGADAVVYVITEQAHGQPEPGRAHHAGVGGPWQGVPADQGNGSIIGLSGQCNGAHPLATHPALYQAMVQTTAALCRRYGLIASQVLGHKEWTSRKIDPRDSMAQVRAHVGAALAGGTPQPQPGPQPGRQEMVIQAPSGSWWLLQGNHLCSITAQAAANARAGGLPGWAADPASWDNISRTYPTISAGGN